MHIDDMREMYTNLRHRTSSVSTRTPAMAMEVVQRDNGDYEEIDEIQQDETNTDDYEYPTTMGEPSLPPMRPRATSQQMQHRRNGDPNLLGSFPPPAPSAAQGSHDQGGFDDEIVGYAKAYELLDHDQKEALIPESSSSLSDSSLSESEKVFKEIRQTFPTHHDQDDDILLITGTLEDNRPPISFKSSVRRRSGAVSEGMPIPEEEEEEEEGEVFLEEQGIYQGLVITDDQRRQLGIMPESIYMTTTLEHWLDNMAANEPHPSPDRPVPSPIKPSSERKPSVDNHLNRTPRSVKPYYRDYVVRAPPLPPVDSKATRAERKAHAVVDQLLRSEAAFLSSLNIAIQIYMKPLYELSQCSAPILDGEQIKVVFGPVEQIASHHELFYSALLSRTLDWHTKQKIGDVFMSSMHNKALMKYYTSYVNNFAVAMNMLERSIQKKPNFVEFLKQKYVISKTSLSLQGLLLKPIQRFPQYILFLTDLLKYTSHTHPDRITLQMALANLEGIAGYLNEAKRIAEQKAVVNNLSLAVTRLPFRLADSQQRRLHRQDVVTRLFVKSGGHVSTKHRCLLLFNNMLICAAAKRKRKAKSTREELESTTGSREFKGTVDTTYTCKWFAPLHDVLIEEPDYNADVWDKALIGGGGGEFENDTRLQNYQQLKDKYKAVGKDFEILTRIATLIYTLSDEYQGLTKNGISDHIRVLQRKLAKLKEQIKSCQLGRIDLSIPSRDGTRRAHHTYRFSSEQVKDEWINAVRFAKLRLADSNRCAWVTGEDFEDDDEEVFSLTHKLPLVVETSRLSMIDNSASVMCAAKVGENTAWMAGGGSKKAQVTIVECVTPKPIVLECFEVDSSRIMDILFVPPAAVTQNLATLTATMKRVSMRNTLQGAGSLTSIPPHLATVWLGAQCGKLSIYSAESMGDGDKKCLATVKFNDAITSLCYYHDQVYLSTAEGNIYIFKRTGSIGWDLVNRRVVEITGNDELSIRCNCRVSNKLWLGAGGSCYILNLQTLKVESSIVMTKRENAVVSHMACWGEGVWVSYRTISSLELWHTVTKNSLQDINIKDTITGILSVHHFEPKVKIPEFMHVTALMASCGFLWIGTSIGIILIYHIPYLEGIPIVSGKPYLAMDGHKGAVRVLLPVKTMATISSSRVGQFLSDEQTRRRSVVSQFDEDEFEDMNKLDLGVASSLAERENGEDDGSGEGGTLKQVRGQVSFSNVPGLVENGVKENDFDKSLTPPFPLEPPPEGRDNQTVPQTAGDNDAAEEEEEEKEEEEDKQDEQVQQDDQVNLATEQGEDNQNGEITLKRADKEVEIQEDATGQDEEEGEGDKDNGRVEVSEANVNDADGENDEPSYEFGDANEEEVELGVVRQNGTEGEGNVELLTNGSVDESGIYSNPIELDLRPRKPANKKEDDNIYDIPKEILPPEVLNKLPANYEAPSKLNEKGPVTTRGGLFSPEFAAGVGPSSFTLPGREVDKKQGAIFVLTSGRGLANLRPGIRSPMLFPKVTLATNTSKSKSKSKSGVNRDEEGCMISYEVELSN